MLLSSAAYLRYVVHTDSDKSDTTNQTLDALNELVSSGNVWDSAVNKAMMLIENEERSIFYGPTSSQAPSSALRLVLQSSLQTTQMQCDNVRQLLSALTSPATLSQLSEMYAPPSPVRPPISLADSPRSPIASNTMRPFSLPMTTPRRQRTISSPTTSPADKRATWNGSYAALALAGSPTGNLLKRKSMHRRSDLSSLFPPMPSLSSISAPVSPQAHSPVPKSPLEDVAEEENDPTEGLEFKGYFGAAALELQRKRKTAAFEVFGIPPPSYASSAGPSLSDPPLRSPVRASLHSRANSGASPTFSSSSRLTSVHTTRHPLSLSGLHLALQGALSAKRYTCSHLLALRFNEDEDDTYWENVRSVMALLTSAFADASSRLVEALDDAEKRRIKDEHPTPPVGPTRLVRDGSISPLRAEFGLESRRARTMAEMVSFAPMPSALSRFGAHHLPPPGGEQVYEAETSSGAPFTRERSKLSREERIKIAKARRASGIPVLSSTLASADDAERYQPRGERWGPGGEVVQELKDVIWKVGEKRRKFSERTQPQPQPQPESEAAHESQRQSGPAPEQFPVAARSDEFEADSESRPEHTSVSEQSHPVVPIDTLRTELQAALFARGADEDEADESLP
ncbi:hypothetical protein BN946_scf184851.g76 [Trametes cinnabarina]|uniref:Uncharacterized protein n=1 Tax=Pycnoporus cinnabarinus TaxID=5643 RepID=A0A060SBC7_PYCCI|nr:hypothetical protein BN946_scf184851.g76 [Trametes cinnabarina]